MSQTNIPQMHILTQYPCNASGTLAPDPIMLQIQFLHARLTAQQWTAQQSKYRNVHTETIEIERRDGYVAVVQSGEVAWDEASDAFVLDALLAFDLNVGREVDGALDEGYGHVPHFFDLVGSVPQE